MGTEKRQRQRANRQLKYVELAKVERRRRLTRRTVVGAISVILGVGLVVGIAWLGSTGGDDDDQTTASTLPVASVPTTVSASTVPGTSPVSTAPGASVGPAEFAYGTGECPPENVTEPVRTFSAAPQLCIDTEADYTATFRTSEGDIVVDLNTAEVPGTVNNFVTLARYGYYDDTLIFRTDPSIDVIQGGGRSNTDSPGYEIPDEADGFTYEPGQLAMARTAAPNSAGGQWFFVTGPNGSNLDAQGTYVVFGEITSGLDVAQRILDLSGPDGQTPSRDVTLDTVEITET